MVQTGFDYVEMTVSTGGTVWITVASNTGCSVTAQTKTQVEVAALPTSLGATPAGLVEKSRDCGTSVVAATTADYVTAPRVDSGTTPTNPDPLPTDGTAWTAGNPNDTDDTGQAVTFNPPTILTDPTTN